MVGRKQSRWRSVLLFIAVLATVIAGVGYLFWPQIYPLIEDELIYARKAKHWATYSSGAALPGTPDPANLKQRLADRGMELGAPIFIRIFKRDFELEVWMNRNGRYELFETYPVCMWSGGLGPKKREGDKQAPEGFYTVEPTSLNPNSKYHLSFNLGYPNAFDRSHGRTGSFLMVHGDCRSIGCYAMTNRVIDEIWSLLTSAFSAGQKHVQVQAFPFRMTETNMSLHASNPNNGFWRQLKVGHDAFLRDGVPPIVSVCDGRYAIKPGNGDAGDGAPIEVNCPAT
ncbi:murein L,D-transpeptidase family protein [Hyphomicrobium sp. D-2]|uniref:murein L,D-transpeptidase family protein n=1 Tax=Hyphomicrobium sp. D-2 TaxID=3041621 RepID=UPI0024574DB1|nr:murein L,D-transpeptidase family protein [Hyphomicrobium sp. D-2]MDH4983529.1 murein L,D-transpeptidase [Hyphomicrobium sp. D-2]